MIITTPFKMDIGKVYTEKELNGMPFEMMEETYLTYRFLVIRETTHKEYRDYIETVYDDPENVIDWNFFYEISMD